VAACPRCGYGNDDVAGFCANPDCRADLRTDAVAEPAARGHAAEVVPAPVPVGGPAAYRGAAPPVDRPPAAPAGRPVETDDQRRGVRITMDEAELAVEPGGTASTTVTVRNRGTRVEQFRLGVNGPAAAFAQVHPPQLSVFPDDEQSAVVTFTAPRAPWPPAGRAPFQVVVRSDVHADVADRAVGAVTVGRFDQLRATLEPETTRGRRPGRHLVNIVNQGNAPLMVQVALADRDAELSYDPPAFQVPVAPGQTEVGEVRVGGPLRWFGRAQSLPFTATVTAAGVPQPVLLNGVRRQLPRFPWWIPTAALALVALLILLYSLWPGAKVPSVAQLDRLAAATALEDAGYVPLEIVRPDPTTPKGIATGTEPAANAEYDKGERVQLFVSAGPCPDPCPIPVPNVIGLPRPEAEAALTSAQFRVERVDPVQNDRPADQVIATMPAAGTEAAIGTGVVLTTSLGPVVAPTSSVAPTDPAGGGGGGGGGGAGGEPVLLPDVVGKPGDVAARELEGLGVKVERTRVRSNAAPRDQVLSMDPAAGEPAVPGATVTLALAEPTGPTDLVAAAADAMWISGAGELRFPGVEGDPNGFALVREQAVLEDLGTAVVLETTPNAAPNGAIAGEFAVPAVGAGDRLRGMVGFLSDGVGPVEFVVVVGGRELARVEEIAGNGALTPLDVDLTPAVGATDVQITVVAVAPGARGAVWKDLRIEGRSG
jgi:beta-lactam-binding protein with PASTA domain